MPCDQFRKLGYLFLFGELDAPDKIKFKKHLRSCPECRRELKEVKETWTIIQNLPIEKPDTMISEKVIQYAKGKYKKKSFLDQIGKIQNQIQHNRFKWMIPVAAVGLIAFFLLMPFGPEKSNGDIYAWNDQFYLETNLIENDLDSIESETLFGSYSDEQNDNSSDKKIGNLSDDLDWIQSEIEKMIETLHGL